MYEDEKKLMDKGIATFRNGKVNEAEQIFHDFVRQYPSSSLADNACYNLAKIAMRRGDNKTAIIWYEYLLETYPDSDAAYFGKDEYTELMRSMGEDTPELADECYYNGLNLMKRGKMADAEVEFNRIITDFPDCEYVDNAYYELAVICKRRGDMEGCKRNVEIIMTQYADTDAALIARELIPASEKEEVAAEERPMLPEKTEN